MSYTLELTDKVSKLDEIVEASGALSLPGVVFSLR